MSAFDQAEVAANPRLTRLQAAWVIARRDFIAVLFSRALSVLSGRTFVPCARRRACRLDRQTGLATGSQHRDRHGDER